MIDEAEIVRRCRQGDTAAFAPLVERYQAQVLAFAASMLRDREEARDAAQEAFIQAFIGLASFDDRRSFRSWLLGIVAKRCLDRLRKQRTFFRFVTRYQEEVPLCDPPVEGEDRVYRLLARLPARQRLVIWLSAVGGCSNTEIAQALGCSESTVRVHVCHARKQLQKEIHGEL